MLRFAVSDVLLCPLLSGVYAIEHISGRKYIGSSKDIRKRWMEHLRDLKRGKHDNLFLQRAWAKYGAAEFSFLVLEECPPTELVAREQCHLDSTQVYDDKFGFNISKNVAFTALGLKRRPETLIKMSQALSGPKHPCWGKPANKEAHAKAMAKVRGRPKPNSGKRKSAKLESPEGKIVEFTGIRGFCRTYHLSPGNISKVLSGQMQQSKGWHLPSEAISVH